MKCRSSLYLCHRARAAVGLSTARACTQHHGPTLQASFAGWVEVAVRYGTRKQKKEKMTENVNHRKNESNANNAGWGRRQTRDPAWRADRGRAQADNGVQPFGFLLFLSATRALAYQHHCLSLRPSPKCWSRRPPCH